MAVRNFYVVNPTGVDITTNAKTAKARRVTQLAFDDAALVNGMTDMAVFFTAGCTVAPTQATFEQRQQAGELLQVEEEDVIGAGGLA